MTINTLGFGICLNILYVGGYWCKLSHFHNVTITQQICTPVETHVLEIVVGSNRIPQN